MKKSKKKSKENAYQSVDKVLLIPSGSTLLNLACSDSRKGGYQLRKITTIPGSSGSGKTFLALTSFAKACKLKRFDEYDLIYDDVEEANEFNFNYLFGKKTGSRIVPPNLDIDNPIYSNTIQDFRDFVLQRCNSDRPFIYILDSLDALTSNEELEKEYKKALLRAKNPDMIEKIAGSYKTEKAKYIGEILRIIKGRLSDTESALLIIQQERTKIGGMVFDTDTTSGGRAPKFYSTHQIWLKRIKTLKDKGTAIGIDTKAMIKKNKLTGKERTVNFNIYYDYGIDDISSCIEYLLKERVFKGSGKKIIAEPFEIECSKRKLVDYIESNNLENTLSRIVEEAWLDHEESIKLKRKRRFF